MNYGIILLTFLSVNFDFFFMLIFLLKKYKLRQVLLGYLVGNLVLITASYFIGTVLSSFLPEWILGILEILPIYLAFRDCDDDAKDKSNKSPFISVLVTYLSVCAGCNLSIFLPVLVGKTLNNFLLILIFIAVLTILVVFIIKLISNLPIVSTIMEKYGDTLMKICYVIIGLYVFWDSGLISHLLKLL